MVGVGEYCGGYGVVYEIEVLEENGVDVFLFGECGKFVFKGVVGGFDGVVNRFCYEEDGVW